MNTRERFQNLLNFKTVDRLPVIEWASWWSKTIERWQSEGLPPMESRETMKYFNLDLHYQDWIRASAASLPKAQEHGKGIIESADDYLAIKEYLYPNIAVKEDRWRTLALEQRSGNAAVWFSLEGFFWFPRTLLGIERHLYSFYDAPELLQMISDDLLKFHMSVIEKISSFCTPDFMTFAEDMSYNNGPMISKELFDVFIKPYYEKLVPFLHEKGIKVIVDSDGYIEKLCGWFSDTGVDGFLPLERNAGCDINSLREKYPGKIFIGAFDKTVMHLGEKALRGEFERLLPAARKGGFIISCDHQTPPEVSLNDYKLYLRIFDEYSRKI